MKKLSVFLSVAAVLFFGSCADLSVGKEERTADLPAGFDWQVYVEINKDVAMSQIILDVAEKNRAYKEGTGTAATADSTQKAVANCATLLLDNDDFAKTIYLKYAQCPQQGWVLAEQSWLPTYQEAVDQYGKCSGIYANNENYNKPIIVINQQENRRDTVGWSCVIAGCWRGGWDQISDLDAQCVGEETEDIGKPWCGKKPEHLSAFLNDSLKNFRERNRTSIDAIKTMCMFMMHNAENLEEAQAYLKKYYYFEGDKMIFGSNFNSYLAELHYLRLGQNDGRPYKYCEQGHAGAEKDKSLADVRSNGYHDYSKYTFCFDKNDLKVYVSE
ncbi:MAG: hypothetical protein FWH22_01210 [Fibromonadales bacterium]|nr:hypothetical protein [Fibromonadales bacterium]